MGLNESAWNRTVQRVNSYGREYFLKWIGIEWNVNKQCGIDCDGIKQNGCELRTGKVKAYEKRRMEYNRLE